MITLGGLLRSGMLCGAIVLLSGCASIYRSHGYTPDDTVLQNVIVGVDTQATVADTVGRPTVTGVLQQSDWYYVESEWRHFAWRAPEEVNREVLAIRFDEDGVVQNIERFGLEDGQVVALSRRVTDENTRGIGFLRQLFGNVGNFAADQLLSDN